MKKKHYFPRKELYELVWEEPRTKLAKRLGLSDVAIGKACRKAGIPMPPAGHWAKKAAGKHVARLPLPPRDPGIDNDIKLSGERYYSSGYWTDEEVLEMVPELPSFDESLHEVRQRIKARLGKVVPPRSLKAPHHLIARLLAEDEERRVKTKSSDFILSWDRPKFESPIEKRRLRILSGIFTATEKCNSKGFIKGKNARDVGVKVGDQFVRLDLEEATTGKRLKDQKVNTCVRLKLTLGHGWHNHCPEPLVWEDCAEKDLESLLPEVVIELILMGERQYRSHKEYQYQYILERKAELEENERQRIETENQLELERVERLKQARIQRLLDDAAAHRQACEIRDYVGRVLTLISKSSSCDLENVEAWAEWARAQADLLDPITTGRLDMNEPILE
ncbi:MAG: hypothetical protein AB2687_13645 [Candidatus Thiodiazotropha taylori]